MSTQPVDVIHEGTRITLPVINGQPMTYREGIHWLQRKEKEENEEVAIHHEFRCSPLDGMVALQRALSEIYGWVNCIPTPGFFGDTPPKMIGVAVGPDESIQVPFGRIQVPGVTGYFQTQIKTNENPAFVMSGETQRKYLPQIQKIVELVREKLRKESIYKGKAVKVSWEFLRQGRSYDPMVDCPQFMALDPSLEASLIFGDRVAKDLSIGLFTPIEQSEACRKYGVPLKRGVLLYGPYGTGKTLTANITAIKAGRNGWTFVYLDSVLDLKLGLQFAQAYAPAVVFCEDIDRVMSGERSVGLDDVLNTLDGVDTKNGEIITVFTTNHIEKLNPAVLRMGRLDAIVEVSPPDAGAAERLVRLYARDLLEPTADLRAIGERLAGKIPAFIREVTERAKICAIARLTGGDIKGHVTQADLMAAANAMETHNGLIWNKRTASRAQRRLVLEFPEKMDVSHFSTGTEPVYEKIDDDDYEDDDDDLVSVSQ